jgi:transposase
VTRYGVVLDRLACTAEEYGITVDVRREAWTSQECPNCGRGDLIVEPTLFLDPESDEVIGREFQCVRCSYHWEDRPGERIQSGVEAYL